MTEDWREKWEQYATIERQQLDKLPVDSLLEKVQTGDYGDYYNIWYSIAERSNLQAAGWKLFDILNQDIDYLYRYHCAAALIKLTGNEQFQPVQLSGNNHNYKENLAILKKNLQQSLNYG